MEVILHFCCRDRNLLSMQSDLLGLEALGLKNVLIVTGDPPKLGDYPDATAVFDVDSIGLMQIANRLNHAQDLVGNPTERPTGLAPGLRRESRARSISTRRSAATSTRSRRGQST